MHIQAIHMYEPIFSWLSDIVFVYFTALFVLQRGDSETNGRQKMNTEHIRYILSTTFLSSTKFSFQQKFVLSKRLFIHAFCCFIMDQVFFSSRLSHSLWLFRFDWKITSDIRKDRPRSGFSTSNVHLFMNLCLYYIHLKFWWWAMNFIFGSWFAHKFIAPTHTCQPAIRPNNLYRLNNVDSNDDHLRLITKVQSQFTIFLKLFPFISSFVHVTVLYPASKFFNNLLNFQNHSNLPYKFQIHQIQNYFATKSSSAIIHCKNYSKCGKWNR